MFEVKDVEQDLDRCRYCDAKPIKVKLVTGWFGRLKLILFCKRHEIDADNEALQFR